ncbi:MAG: DUF1553 domain-containing protein [Isosphaeraceae bacterium]
MTISPESVELASGDPGFQLIVEGRGSRGGRRDVTGEVAWSFEPQGVVTVDPSGYVRPIATGEAQVSATLDGNVVVAKVQVISSSSRSWNFGEDVVPILTRAGCNAGSCHGRADGQNGFHLSLFGYDPIGDHRAITRDGGGRRLSRFDPARSLLLEKATGRVPHGGGRPVVPGTPEYLTLLAWLEAGAPESRGETHGALEAVVIEPGDARLDDPGPRQLRVVARYADGHRRDVTRLSHFRVNDDSAISVNSAGKATLLKRAEADLVVRYQSKVLSVRLGTIVNPDLDFDFAALPRRNVVDEELFKRLESLKVPPSPRSGDAAFLRRVSLDLTGLQPLPEEVRAFLADTDPDKRIKRVDRLLDSREFVLFWKIKFGDLLQISQARFNNGAAYYHTWLEEQLQNGTPWDQSVRTLMTALGNPTVFGGGPVNYALDGPDAQTRAEQTAQRFLGLRLRCAQCHDHPFDVWTQDDYFGLAAFFAKVQREGQGMGGRPEVTLDPKGTVTHLRTKTPASPRLLDGSPVTIPEGEDPRKTLAEWMTAPENPYFARAMANWVWAQHFGKGLADPPDDLSQSNPPVHPELLDALARHFVERKFDLKNLIRTIATSEAYGLSSETVPGNETDQRLFSHHIPRPLTAHQMADALAQATDVPNRFYNDRSIQPRAIEIYDPGTRSAILDTFGRCDRTVTCASVATPPLSLRQSLLLIGGDVIESKVSSLNGYLANLLELEPEPDEVVANLYLRTLCRPPSAEELSRWSAELAQSSSLREAAEDLFWALLNSREFAFNH